MSSDNENVQLQMYKDDPRIPCQFGVKCYQKNPQHHSKYKHPPKKEMMNQRAEKTSTSIKRKNPLKDDKKRKSPQRKLQKISEFCQKNLHDMSPSPERNNIRNSNEDGNKNFNVKTEVSDKDMIVVQTSSKQYDCSLESVECSVVENILSTSNADNMSDAEKIIMDLFLVEMPIDFFQFYEFCKSISKDNPLLACKSVSLKLVGPYDVLDGKIKDFESASDKEKYLIHWRYYYDPPEFQTIIKCDGKEELHYGYWRDTATEKPVFVAKNRANINCIFESVAENIFGAIDTNKKSFYDLQKILKQIEESGTSDERKTPFAKLDEIVRLATIAADECDFGTCLELGHDLFSNGGIHVQTTVLQMLSIAYTHLQRLQFLKILKAHLRDRKRGCELSVI
ncbi:histone PARylation factor 1-like [Formica exsecta]|uniref:histone PARylation factor 1-like n=1 Tax=Formica exsecta TaxID=72781 RepID=UPI0011417086|nr:histone PARylation factor 1-like [Formica exsecta]